MFTRDGDDDKSRIEMFDLIKLAVRYRPDYIIVGEVRGEEVHAMLQASALGHGMLTTFHASTPEELMVRLTSPPLNVNTGNLQLISTVVFTTIRNGKRLVTDIVEPSMNNGDLEFKSILTSSGDLEIEKSQRLRILSKTYGINITDEIKKREKLLKNHANTEYEVEEITTEE
jgi:flagellar protein FlaI